MAEFGKALWAYLYPTEDKLKQQIGLAKWLGCDAMICKCGNGATFYDYQSSSHIPWVHTSRLVRTAGLKLGAEIYAYGHKPYAEGSVLARAIHEGASFAVVNAEHEFERASYEETRKLVNAFALQTLDPLSDLDEPRPNLYVCSDVRLDRLTYPYMRAFQAGGVAGFMPMAYPLEYRPSKPLGFVQEAFNDVMERCPRPAYPVIQAHYRTDYHEALAQIVLAWRWGAEGVSIYVGHDITGHAAWGLRDAPGREVYQGAEPAAPAEPVYTRSEILDRVADAFEEG